MSLVDHLMRERDKLWLAKELAATALDNARLKERIARLEVELFWAKTKLPVAAEPELSLSEKLQQSLNRIDAMNLRRHVRLVADERHQVQDRRNIKGKVPLNGQ
ncbi:MAG: hypothetical protein JO253_04625 [Alphaproteobacteria bacterium]|nr:hypothetical protein [Alphaproteobacteria bacterium]